MGLAVGEQVEDGLRLGTSRRLLGLIVGCVETDVALLTVVALLLSEVAQQLTAAADGIVRRVVNHGVDALAELFLALFIDSR